LNTKKAKVSKRA